MSLTVRGRCYTSLVRGGSRLDLYAKSLAVLLLGSMGLAGALVDYWPATQLPVAASPSFIALTPAVQTAFDLPGFTPLTSDVVRAVERRPTPVVSRAVAEVELLGRAAPDPVEPASEAVVAALLDPPPAVLARLELTELPAAPPIELVAAADLGLSSALESTDPPFGVVSTEDRNESGLLSGMLKKTGSSVTASLGKASNSLLGAVRVVGDAVRWAF